MYSLTPAIILTVNTVSSSWSFKILQTFLSLVFFYILFVFQFLKAWFTQERESVTRNLYWKQRALYRKKMVYGKCTKITKESALNKVAFAGRIYSSYAAILRELQELPRFIIDKHNLNNVRYVHDNSRVRKKPKDKSVIENMQKYY